MEAQGRAGGREGVGEGVGEQVEVGQGAEARRARLAECRARLEAAAAAQAH